MVVNWCIMRHADWADCPKDVHVQVETWVRPIMYLCMRVGLYVHMQACMRVCMDACMHVGMYVCMYGHMYCIKCFHAIHAGVGDRPLGTPCVLAESTWIVLSPWYSSLIFHAQGFSTVSVGPLSGRLPTPSVWDYATGVFIQRRVGFPPLQGSAASPPYGSTGLGQQWVGGLGDYIQLSSCTFSLCTVQHVRYRRIQALAGGCSPRSPL
jgi:hypothetical protein|mmetsp:Transcript_3182/g.6039  ORF Transcript_3182/g.6039 Transcript_3182/m.6039 type:complete len:209 (-) Transcript_3182:1160-1786(-)